MSAWLSESVAVTSSATAPDEGTGFGLPVGPAVTVTECGGGSTRSLNEPCTLIPFGSATSTRIVQNLAAPVALTGATQIVLAAYLLPKVPGPGSPTQKADQ